MKDKYWFYLKDDKIHGPVSESTLQEMLRDGTIKPETLIKSLLINWTQAKKTKVYRVAFQPPATPTHNNMFAALSERQQSTSESHGIGKFLTRILNIMKKIMGIRS